MTSEEKRAWETLGLNQDAWVHQEVDSLAPWSKLSSDQKSAAKYGLGITADVWESRRKDRCALETTVGLQGPPATPPPPVRVDISGMSRGSSPNAPVSLFSRLAQLVSQVVSPPSSNNHDLSRESGAPPVVVNSVETTLYLDDSSSMREFVNWWNKTTRLSEGKEVLRWLVPAIGSSPCRVLTFSGSSKLVRPRTGSPQSRLSIVREEWNGRGSGGTYMWHMIEQDVLRRYLPGTSKLRLVVITDGDDNASPKDEYLGMEGMNPMMKTLHEAGYDIEWHIIVVGDEAGLEGYEALAGATGGTFLCVKTNFDPSCKELQSMLHAIQNSTDEQGRRIRQLNYESNLRSGRRQEWFKQLPA